MAQAFQSLSGQPVQRVSWEEHVAYLWPRWEPGQHVSIIAPTGRGKDWLITRGLLPLWRDHRVLYFDTKDFDPTLKGFGHRVQSFPNRLYRLGMKRENGGQWFRLHIRSALAGTSHRAQRQTAYAAMAGAYREREWVIVVSEISHLANDLQLMPALRDIWKRGRANVTFIAAGQAPRWLPGEMYDQSSYLYLGPLRDTYARKRLSEIGGNTDEIKAALGQLRRFEWLFVDALNEEGEMQIVKVGR
jgi:hypothetical protein